MEFNTLTGYLRSLGYNNDICKINQRLLTCISSYYYLHDYLQPDDLDKFPSDEVVHEVVAELNDKGWWTVNINDIRAMDRLYELAVDINYDVECANTDTNKPVIQNPDVFYSVGKHLLESIDNETDDEFEREDRIYEDVREILYNQNHLLNKNNRGYLDVVLCGSDQYRMFSIKSEGVYEIAFAVSLEITHVFDRLFDDMEIITDQINAPAGATVEWSLKNQVILIRFDDFAEDKQLSKILADSIISLYKTIKPRLLKLV